MIMLDVEQIKFQLCRRLRWKGMYVEAAPDLTVPPSNDAFFWCNDTMTCLGPDGNLANEEKCQSDRGCHEPL